MPSVPGISPMERLPPCILRVICDLCDLKDVSRLACVSRSFRSSVPKVKYYKSTTELDPNADKHIVDLLYVDMYDVDIEDALEDVEETILSHEGLVRVNQVLLRIREMEVDCDVFGMECVCEDGYCEGCKEDQIDDLLEDELHDLCCETDTLSDAWSKVGSLFVEARGVDRESGICMGEVSVDLSHLLPKSRGTV